MGKKKASEDWLTPDIKAIRASLKTFLDSTDEQGRRLGSATRGVYAFYDYDGEPIYVGQTVEQLGTRVRRHLTNQRTDAVAMRVLDPMEVFAIEVWPFWDLQGLKGDSLEVKDTLNRAEWTVYDKLQTDAQSRGVSKLLNEKLPPRAEPIELPQARTGIIVPESLRDRLGHPDERIARRAATVATLAQVIRERDVSLGLRETLVAQAQRLELLARRRANEVRGEMPEAQVVEETHEHHAEELG